MVSLQPIPQLPYQCMCFSTSKVLFLRYFAEPHPSVWQLSLAVLRSFPRVCANPDKEQHKTLVQSREPEQESICESWPKPGKAQRWPWTSLAVLGESHEQPWQGFILIFAQPIRCPRGTEHFGASLFWTDSKPQYGALCKYFTTQTTGLNCSSLSIQLAMFPRGCNCSWAFARHRIIISDFLPLQSSLREVGRFTSQTFLPRLLKGIVKTFKFWLEKTH